MSFLAPLRLTKSIRIAVSSTSQLHPAYQSSPSTRTPFRIHGHSHRPGTIPTKHRLLSTMSDPRPIFFFDIDNCVRIVDRFKTWSRLLIMLSNSFTQEVRNPSHPALGEYSIARPTANQVFRAESNIHDEMQKLIRTSILYSPTPYKPVEPS